MAIVQRTDVDVVETAGADPHGLHKVDHQLDAGGKFRPVDHDPVPFNKEEKEFRAGDEQPQSEEDPGLTGGKEVIIVEARIPQELLQVLAELPVAGGQLHHPEGESQKTRKEGISGDHTKRKRQRDDLIVTERDQITAKKSKTSVLVAGNGVEEGPPPRIVDSIGTHHGIGRRIGGEISTHDDEGDHVDADNVSRDGDQEDLEDALCLCGQLLVIVYVGDATQKEMAVFGKAQADDQRDQADQLQSTT